MYSASSDFVPDIRALKKASYLYLGIFLFHDSNVYT